MQNKPSKWVPGFKHSPRSSNTQAFQMGLFLNVPTGKFEPIDSSWDNVHSGGLFISGANKIYFRDETNKDTYINSPADDQLALYASTVLIAKDTDGDGTGLVVSNLDTNNPPLASTIDMLEIGTVFGTADTYGFRLKYDGDTNNFEVQSGNETTVDTRMVIERDTGNVGIGTDDPGQKLEVSSAESVIRISDNNSTGTAALAYVEMGSDTGTWDVHSFIGEGSSGNSDVYIYNYEDAGVQVFTDSTQALVIDNSQDVTVSAGNLVIGTAGKGIDFSIQTATSASGATTTAELLDHYEEGTWTGVITDGSNDATMEATGTTGAYTRIGNLVTCTGFFQTSSLGSISGAALQLKGLPFTIFNNNKNYSSCAVGYATSLSITAGENIGGYGSKSAANIILTVWDDTGGVTSLTDAMWTADGRFMITFSYTIN